MPFAIFFFFFIFQRVLSALLFSEPISLIACFINALIAMGVLFAAFYVLTNAYSKKNTIPEEDRGPDDPVETTILWLIPASVLANLAAATLIIIGFSTSFAKRNVIWLSSRYTNFFEQNYVWLAITLSIPIVIGIIVLWRWLDRLNKRSQLNSDY